MYTEIEALFSSAARVEILALFLLNKDRQFYQREIERETGQPIRAVQREVKRLAEIDLLCHSTEGNRILYRLNPGFALLPELSALFQKAAGVEGGSGEAGPVPSLPPEPASIDQPFAWISSPPTPALPLSLRRMQVQGDWDRAY
jgi:hypothetical protein